MPPVSDIQLAVDGLLQLSRETCEAQMAQVTFPDSGGRILRCRRREAILSFRDHLKNPAAVL